MKARLPDGFSGKGQGNMQNMLKQAKKLQDEMAALQEELDKREYSASVGGGAVTATVTGKHIVTALEIKHEVVDPDDVEMLSDLVMAAVNEAIRKADKSTQAEMARISGGLSLPGLF